MKEITLPLDVHYIDQLVEMSRSNDIDQINTSQRILSKFASNKHSIQSVNDIISQSSSDLTHLFALNIFESTIKSPEYMYYPEELKQKIHLSIKHWHSLIGVQTNPLLYNKLINLYVSSSIVLEDKSSIKTLLQYDESIAFIKLKTIIEFFDQSINFSNSDALLCVQYSVSHLSDLTLLALKTIEKTISFVNPQTSGVVAMNCLNYIQQYQEELLVILAETFHNIIQSNPQSKVDILNQFINKITFSLKPSNELALCLNEILPETDPPSQLFELMMKCSSSKYCMKYLRRYCKATPMTIHSYHIRILEIILNEIPQPPNTLFINKDDGFIENVEAGGVDYDQFIRTLVVLCESGITEELIDHLISSSTADGLDELKLIKTIWAIIGISGKVVYKTESIIFTRSLTFLLTLFGEQTESNTQELIAQLVMALISKFPRFLCHKSEILGVVLHKIFEFVNDPRFVIERTAVGTLVKVCYSCSEAIINNIKCIDEIYKGCTSGEKLPNTLRGGFYDALGVVSQSFSQTEQMYYDYVGMIIENSFVKFKESIPYFNNGVTPYAIQMILPHLISLTHFLAQCKNIAFPLFPQIVLLMRELYLLIIKSASEDTQIIDLCKPALSLLLTFFSKKVISNDIRVILIEVIFPSTTKIPVTLITPSLLECCCQLIELRNSKIIIETIFKYVIVPITLSSSIELHDCVFSFIKKEFNSCSDHIDIIKDTLLNAVVPVLLEGLKRDSEVASFGLESIACCIPLGVDTIEFVFNLVLKGKSYISLLKVLLNGITTPEQLIQLSSKLSNSLHIPVDKATELVQTFHSHSRNALIPFTQTVISFQVA
ncbi:hypothetical protein EDI_172350 [Entamoeba dispar SAW760]|uniref:Importin N-terminal domain-containing protein n=1 Tax=Entamoeba dispar (strain ATCC PRA-260 / SAW760) TaxID=370354 RepID=B0EIN8_ENTDS|nr:uncharacterized protein EDI_172350 [Entamoeba dispar SAW760]EDR25589.1 hypothetical protein EDI_172350 [Entamoeba dispar SAW760]|eukprot:EDR25589.1 hypothetical protein EDI_172350 [Entamoeba dispar SAW760]